MKEGIWLAWLEWQFGNWEVRIRRDVEKGRCPICHKKGESNARVSNVNIDKDGENNFWMKNGYT